MNVVTRNENEIVSFMVDSVGNVLEVDDEYFEPVPNNVEAATRELVSGVYKLEDRRLLMVLDVAKAANLSTVNGTTP